MGSEAWVKARHYTGASRFTPADRLRRTNRFMNGYPQQR